MSTAPDVERIIARVTEEVGSDRYDRYFGKQAELALDGSGLRVTVTTPFVADLLGKRFGECLRRAARAECGRDVPVRFTVDDRRFGRGERAPEVRRARSGRGGAVREPAARRQRYRLETFVVGDPNRIAHAAAVRFAQGEAPFRSLFIHGRCGVGKTHLLHGIAARFRQTRPDATVRVITAEAFKVEYVSAVRAGSTDRFRRAYRGVDLLCLDDVHLLSGREGTQNELLHTFDAIDLGGARVALASDAHPRQIREFHGGLVSRFLAGMVARIDPPDADLCERLAHHLAGQRRLVLEPEAARILAAHAAVAGGSVRELEGMIVRVEAVHRLLGDGSGRLITAEDARRAIGLAAPPTRRGRPRGSIHIGEIIASVCTALGVEPSALHGKGRHKRVVLARGLVAHLARELTTMSYPEIGRSMSRPNHSSVITARNRVAAQIERSEPLAAVTDGAPLRWPDVRSLADHLRCELCRPNG